MKAMELREIYNVEVEAVVVVGLYDATVLTLSESFVAGSEGQVDVKPNLTRAEIQLLGAKEWFTELVIELSHSADDIEVGAYRVNAIVDYSDNELAYVTGNLERLELSY